MVVVPPPRTTVRLARQFTGAIPELFRPTRLLILMSAALAMALVLAIPYAGVVLAYGLGAGLAVFYGLLIREVGLEGTLAENRRRPTWHWWAPAIGLALLTPAVLFAPFLLRQRGFGPRHPLDMEGWGLPAGVSLIGWVILPLLWYLVAAHDPSGWLGPRRALISVLKHPIATLMTLMLYPVGLVVAELVVLAVAWQQNWLMVLERDLLLGAYDLSLRRGFTLVGAIPLSLPAGTHTRITLTGPDTMAWSYLAFRIGLTFLIFAAILVSLRLQALWLGRIATVEAWRRPPANQVSSGGPL